MHAVRWFTHLTLMCWTCEKKHTSCFLQFIQKLCKHTASSSQHHHNSDDKIQRMPSVTHTVWVFERSIWQSEKVALMMSQERRRSAGESRWQDPTHTRLLQHTHILIVNNYTHLTFNSCFLFLRNHAGNEESLWNTNWYFGLVHLLCAYCFICGLKYI